MYNELNARFEKAYPQDILRWAADTYGERLALVTSFQPTGIVTLHMLQEIAPHIPVMTLDTGLLFPETYALMDEIEARFGLKIQRIHPRQTVEEQAQTHGANLWERDPDQCCNLRKVAPLGPALEGYDAWLTGLRRDQSSTRANTSAVTLDKRYNKTKISPFINWTEEMLWIYIDAHNLPYNTLHEMNYPSIGCAPCTRPVAEGEDIRAGRWAEVRGKTECGIHLPATA